MHNDLFEKGLVIIVFPCNQFMNQEPKPNAEIKTMQLEKYGGKFLMMSKIEVNGKNTHPVYRWLRRNSDMWNKDQGIESD